MADNRLYVPLSNPVKFFAVDRAITDQYQTKHFDDFMFAERLYDWEVQEDFKKIWQKDDIINVQFESSFDPISVDLVRLSDGLTVSTLIGLIGLPNRYLPGTYSYNISMSLGAVPSSGCYKMIMTAGSGDDAVLYETAKMYISLTPLKDSIKIEYWSTKDFHDDVIFKQGLKFQYRIFGYIGKLKAGRASEKSKDQKFNPTVLSSRQFRQWPVSFGDKYGIPDDEIDLLNSIMGHNQITFDKKFFSPVDDEFEYFDIDLKPKRGVRAMFEEGINRRSVAFAQATDTTKKLFYSINAESKFFGDLANQGSGNTVPVYTIE